MRYFQRASLLILSLLACGCVDSMHPNLAQHDGKLLDEQWKFYRGEASGGQAAEFDDAAWQAVSLPHTFNLEDGQTRNYYRGPAWYRRHLAISAADLGRRHFLKFDGATLVTKLFVNGQEIGSHAGGFAAFCFDISPYLHAGENTLAVRVDNTLDETVSPISGDFTVFGGLYRDVHLLSLPLIHISPLDDGSSGVYLAQKNVSADSADVSAMVKLRNDSEKPGDVRVAVDVIDAAGHSIQKQETAVALPANSSRDAVIDLKLTQPHLWDGRRDPYLYSVNISVTQGGKVVDLLKQPLGLRSFRVDPQQGLILNDRPYDLHGVNLHQGRPSKGWVSSASDQDEDYALISELGCTGVRMAHYQHFEHEYALCDKMGLVVWTELALVNRAPNSQAFHDNVKQQLRELIKQNFNHPSILFWSLYNEPWHDEAKRPGEWEFVQELNALAHALDPSRLTTGAASMGAADSLNWVMDITGINRYWGWYSGGPDDWATKVDQMRVEAGGKTFGISEYGAGASVKQHQINPPQSSPGGKWHSEEWQSTVHEKVWPVLRDRPWVWCKLLWVMFDFPVGGRNEGDAPGINDKGLVTGDRKTRKDAFYFYKANWSDEPFVYLTSRRMPQRPIGPNDIKAYSNCTSCELFVDDASVGVVKADSHVFVWPNVALPAGRVSLRIVALDSHGRKHEDKIEVTAVEHPATSQMSQ